MLAGKIAMVKREEDRSLNANRASYEETLSTLSKASVERYFNAFKDISWDEEEFAVDAQDPRWVLPPMDVLGGHSWYRALPLEEQIRVGRYRMAQITKVGLQFEQLLVGGMMLYLMDLKNNNPEFRYSMHEVTEETHHIQMFQEFVNRAAPEVYGASKRFKLAAPLLMAAGRIVPFMFFVGILAGEEPIDHLQKQVMRMGGTHPLLDRIMQIHIAEEARHIGFAHQFLQHHMEKLSPLERQAVAFFFPWSCACCVMKSWCRPSQPWIPWVYRRR